MKGTIGQHIIYQSKTDMIAHTETAYNLICDSADKGVSNALNRANVDSGELFEDSFILVSAVTNRVVAYSDVKGKICGMSGNYMFTDDINDGEKHILYAVLSAERFVKDEVHCHDRILNMSAERMSNDEKDASIVEYFVNLISHVCNNLSYTVFSDRPSDLNEVEGLQACVKSEVELIDKCIHDRETAAYIDAFAAAVCDKRVNMLNSDFVFAQFVPDLLQMLWSVAA